MVKFAGILNFPILTYSDKSHQEYKTEYGNLVGPVTNPSLVVLACRV